MDDGYGMSAHASCTHGLFCHVAFEIEFLAFQENIIV